MTDQQGKAKINIALVLLNKQYLISWIDSGTTDLLIDSELCEVSIFVPEHVFELLPIATEALPMDNRNTFINQSVSSLVQVDQALGELKCDSVLFDAWGYPEFVDEELLARWQDYESAREVFGDSEWKFAQII